VCGIVGLHLIDPELHPRLGELLTPMLVAMSTRGPDSSGIAVYDGPLTDGRMRYTVRAGSGDVWTPYISNALGATLGSGVDLQVTADHAMLTTTEDEPRVREALRELVPDAVIVGWGQSLRIVKDVGTPGTRVSAGMLIDRAGCKGLTVGGAVVSDQHANFIVAKPGCKAADVLELMRQVRTKVAAVFGVTLEPEVVIWGATL